MWAGSVRGLRPLRLGVITVFRLCGLECVGGLLLDGVGPELCEAAWSPCGLHGSHWWWRRACGQALCRPVCDRPSVGAVCLQVV